jgi:hypothetical protein
MNRKIVFVFVIALLGSLLLAACNSGPSGKEMTGPEKDAVLAYSEPMTDTILKGLNDNDYATFSHDFSDTLLKGLGPKQFADTKKQLDDKIGVYQSRTVDKVMDYGTMVTVLYKGIFAKNPNMNITVTFDKAEPHKVSGLWFR